MFQQTPYHFYWRFLLGPPGRPRYNTWTLIDANGGRRRRQRRHVGYLLLVCMRRIVTPKKNRNETRRVDYYERPWRNLCRCAGYFSAIQRLAGCLWWLSDFSLRPLLLPALLTSSPAQAVSIVWCVSYTTPNKYDGLWSVTATTVRRFSTLDDDSARSRVEAEGHCLSNATKAAGLVAGFFFSVWLSLEKIYI